jgi:dihydroorotase
LTGISITRPDDWHLHLRDGDVLRAVLPHTSARFARAIVMPNLTPPVTTAGQALAYRDRIVEAIPDGHLFEPLMTLYLTDNTPAEEIVRARNSGAIFGVKLYPAGATTNSESGVTDIEKCYPALESMQACGMPLLVHGEVTGPEVDVFDRERMFIDRTLAPLADRFTGLKIVFEHVTTAEAVAFVESAREGIAATVTPQHILLNRNALFEGGLRPHHYCLPVLKAERHRKAALGAAGGGNPRFFLGTDSAPHLRARKETDCGCAGIYSAHAGIELYAEAFEDAGALDRLEAFASHHGADFYSLPRNTTTIMLERRQWQPPAAYPAAGDEIVPFRAGSTLRWQVVTS